MGRADGAERGRPMGRGRPPMGNDGPVGDRVRRRRTVRSLHHPFACSWTN